MVPHGPSRNGYGLMNTGAADHVSRTNNVSSHLDRHISAHLKIATKGVPFNSHTPMPRQVSGPTQQPMERRFLVLSTLYGPIHILAEGSTLLVTATNIANIYGYNRILNFRGTPSPEKVVTASDSQLRGNYYTIECALQYCDVLNGQGAYMLMKFKHDQFTSCIYVYNGFNSFFMPRRYSEKSDFFQQNVQDIARLMVPSTRHLAIRSAKHLKILTDTVNESWNNSIPLTKRPQPDYAVGFDRSAFPEEQLKRLQRH
ncbi:hypothetical protein K469DRAFT_695860 [Zopfia rhizophila CBS 207.26]|uniref:DUF7924 domain-containing protein n=1 Tax=Zopfia rhizophila CBS 207.26 TaxID=1314779 RepID=A0A6A6EL96_9PEZI|nr:hypothetical protein K469DRAFT_695860 [Zopfia rhizophila CBS 207.26]